MNNYLLKLKVILFMGISMLLISCASSNKEKQLPNPYIKYGSTKISGKLTNYQIEDNIDAIVYLNHPVTSELEGYQIEVNPDGHFFLEIPLETNLAIGRLYLNTYDESYLVNLASGQETKLEITRNKHNKGKIKIIDGPSFISDDLNDWDESFVKASQIGPDLRLKHINKDSVDRFIDNPSEYIPYAIKYDLGQRLELLDKNTKISEAGKTYLNNQFKLLFTQHFFSYTWSMTRLYRETRESGDTSTYVPAKPDKSYYVFLKEFDLNNPQHLYSEYLSDLLENILTEDTLNISPISETPIDVWLTKAKGTLEDLVGFDDGLFYDLLVTRSYTMQFQNKLIPLSEKQKENIHTYYEDSDIEKILLRKNKEVIKLAEGKTKVVVNETSDIPNEEILETIISKYKGRPFLIDYWATWCGPCLNGIKAMKPLKVEMKGKDIVFVYITNTSSPEQLWERQLEGIGGEHYYLNNEQWEYILSKSDFRGIPTYQFYDREGKLKEQITGYPGTEIMYEKIGNLLKYN